MPRYAMLLGTLNGDAGETQVVDHSIFSQIASSLALIKHTWNILAALSTGLISDSPPMIRVALQESTRQKVQNWWYLSNYSMFNDLQCDETTGLEGYTVNGQISQVTDTNFHQSHTILTY